MLISLRKHQENSQVLNEIILPLSPIGHMKILEILPKWYKTEACSLRWKLALEYLLIQALFKDTDPRREPTTTTFLSHYCFQLRAECSRFYPQRSVALTFSQGSVFGQQV